MKTTCYMCKTEFAPSHTWQMQCPRCLDLPTIRFTIDARDPSGAPVHLLSGETVRHGRACRSDAWYISLTGGTMYDTIRRYVADAVAQGCTDVRVQICRHTGRLGWSSDYYWQRGAASPCREVRLGSRAPVSRTGRRSADAGAGIAAGRDL